jgi:hypothetical protein
MSANGELEEGGRLPPDNAIIVVQHVVPIGFQLPLFSSNETRRHIARIKVSAGNEDVADEASLDTYMCQGTM